MLSLAKTDGTEAVKCHQRLFSSSLAADVAQQPQKSSCLPSWAERPVVPVLKAAPSRPGRPLLERLVRQPFNLIYSVHSSLTSCYFSTLYLSDVHAPQACHHLHQTLQALQSPPDEHEDSRLDDSTGRPNHETS